MPASYSVFPRLPIAQVTDELVLLFLPHGGTIYDPCKGIKARQLQDLMNGRLDMRYELVTSDVNPEAKGSFLASVTNVPLQDNSIDLIDYDPPFVPTAAKTSLDPRGKDYGIAHPFHREEKLSHFTAGDYKTPVKKGLQFLYGKELKDDSQPVAKPYNSDLPYREKDYVYGQNRNAKAIYKFYSPEILKELYRVTRLWLIIRGSDFYYPHNSNNLHLFSDFCIRNVRDLGWHIRALYVNQYLHPRLKLYRARLPTRIYQRPIINHSYFLVIKKYYNLPGPSFSAFMDSVRQTDLSESSGSP